MMQIRYFLLVATFCFFSSSCNQAPADSPPVPPVEPPAPTTPRLGSIVRLTQTTTDSETFLNTGKCVAVSADGIVHVAWLEIVMAAPFPGHARQGQIAYSRSIDGGMTFSAPRLMTPLVPEVGTPKLAAANNSVYIVWHQSDGQRIADHPRSLR